MTSTSTFTGDITAPNIYTKTEVNNLLTGKTSSSDITSAISGKADKSTTYTKSNVDSLLTKTELPNFQKSRTIKSTRSRLSIIRRW